MSQRAAFAGSVAIHAAVGLALIAVRSRAPERSTPPRASVEIVDVDPASLVELVEVSNLSSGGGGSGGGASVRAARAELIARVEPRRTRARSMSDSLAEIATASADHEFLDGDRDPNRSVGAGASGGRAPGTGAGTSGDGGGRGGGHGNGAGRGVGLGLGDLAIAGDRLPAPPVAPMASKARPAKLIYPSRERQVDEDAALFVARVTVDRDGYVVGARLTKGQGGPKGDEAAGLIFRFRYAPALDDDGHPIKSQLDQQFLVGP